MGLEKHLEKFNVGPPKESIKTSLSGYGNHKRLLIDYTWFYVDFSLAFFGLQGFIKSLDLKPLQR